MNRHQKGGGPPQYDRLTLGQLKKVKASLKEVKKNLETRAKTAFKISEDFRKYFDIVDHIGLKMIGKYIDVAGGDLVWDASGAATAASLIGEELKKIDKELKKRARR